jgi:hypothetical protein
MKLSLTILSCCFFGFGLNAQKNIESNGIKISTKQINCHIPSEGYESDLIQLTIENLSNSEKTVSYRFELFYDGVCSTCETDEYVYSQTLQAHEVLVGECLDRTHFGLTIFHHMPAHLSKSILTDFNIKNVVVN